MLGGELTEIADEVDLSSVLGYAQRMVCHTRAPSYVTKD